MNKNVNGQEIKSINKPQNGLEVKYKDKWNK